MTTASPADPIATCTHTYTLGVDGFIDPSYMADPQPRTVIVSVPRSLDFKGMTLRLFSNEPDLPVGEHVQVWLESHFRCATVTHILAMREEAKRRDKAIEAHEQTIQERAKTAYLVKTNTLLSTQPSPAAIESHLTALYACQDSSKRTYRAYWHAADPSIKQRSHDAFITLAVIQDSINAVSTHLQKHLRSHDIHGHTAYAYSPREGGTDGAFSPGKDHFLLQTAITLGRYVRQSGDSLCKPAKQFWGLVSIGDERAVTCRLCIARMVQLLEKRSQHNVEK